MNIEKVARVCHAANRAYREVIGEPSGPTWEGSSSHVRNSVRSGIRLLANCPDATGEESHQRWVKYKKKAGWVYGDVKDEKVKTHPNLVKYEDLPDEQKTKDRLFQLICIILL